MKCEYCGGTLSIENEKCPHCMADNPFYEAHRKDMKAYARRYAATEKKVVDKTERFAKRTLLITIIAILFALNIVVLFVNINMWDINYARHERQNRKHAAENKKIAMQLEADGDYQAFNSFMETKYAYSYNGPMNELQTVQAAAGYYRSILQDFGNLIENSYYTDASEFAKRINGHLDSLYTTRKDFDRENYADNERYQENHKASVDQIIKEVHEIIEAYLGIDSETLAQFPEMSSAKRQVLIEEAVEEVYFYE